jgi:hypothetical protein
MTLGVSVAAAVVVLTILYKSLVQGQLNFWLLIGISVFYAVAQGGRHGFLEVAKGVKELLGRKGKEEPKD